MLSAHFFDGRSTRIQVVQLSLVANDLVIVGNGIDLRIPFRNLVIDERLGRAARKIHLGDGAFCEVADLAGLDTLLAAAGHRDGRVDRLQRRMSVAVLAALICVGLAAAAYQWGLPWLAAVGAQTLPPAVSRTLTNQTLKVLDGKMLLPSKLPEDRQAAITTRFHALRLPEGGTPRSTLLFRNSPQLGANAFTLPDGTIVLLDGLVTLVGDDDQILAVLAHELGHAHGRHGVQMLLQSSAIAAFWSFYVGDISQLLAAAPTTLLQAKYSREFEQAADDYGADLLEANGMRPALLADALTKLEAEHGKNSEAAYLASHPPTEERIRSLRQHGQGDHPAQ